MIDDKRIATVIDYATEHELKTCALCLNYRIKKTVFPSSRVDYTAVCSFKPRVNDSLTNMPHSIGERLRSRSRKCEHYDVMYDEVSSTEV